MKALPQVTYRNAGLTGALPTTAPGIMRAKTASQQSSVDHALAPLRAKGGEVSILTACASVEGGTSHKDAGRAGAGVVGGWVEGNSAVW